MDVIRVIRKMYRYGSQLIGEDDKANVLIKAQLIGTTRSAPDILAVQRSSFGQPGNTDANLVLVSGNSTNTGSITSGTTQNN